MTAPMSPVALKSNFSRLGIRCVLCLVCFFVGCTFTLSFMSTLECDRFNTSQKSSSPKFEELNEKTKKTTLLAIILSAPDNVIQRHALRRTWLSLADQELFKFYFVVGSKGIVGQNEDLLLTEEKQYSDLLILPNVEDNYNLLTIKLLASFAWINKHSDFDFVLKVDDDSYVDIRLLLRELSRREEKKRLYWGYFNGRAQIKQKGKWKETNWNMCDRYVPYARGGGYLLSRQLVCYIAENAEILNVYKNEDVSVGMWLAPLNVTHFHDVRFDTEWASRGCSNQHIITHPHDVAEIYKLHETLANNGHMCEVEFQKRPAYNYDWSVLPSECCNSLSL